MYVVHAYVHNLGIHTLKNWEKLEEETGSLQKRELNRNPRKIDREELKKYVEENPFATHIEAAAHFECSESGIRHASYCLLLLRVFLFILLLSKFGMSMRIGVILGFLHPFMISVFWNIILK